MRRILALSLALPFALLTTNAAAQTCVGMPSFSSGQMQVSGGGSFADGASSFGAAVGGLVGHSTQMQILPNASFQFANTRATADDGTTSASASETYGLLTLGTGFVFSSRFSVNPSVSFPMGLDGSSTTFGLSAAMNFGR